MILRLGSIRARLLAAAALWLTLALLAAWWVIGGLLAGFITDRFDAEASAIADTVIAGTQTDEDGGVRLLAPPTDPRLAIPLSLWAWQLQDADGRVIDKAASLLDLYLHPPEAEFAGGPGTGPEGEPLRVLHRRFTLPGEDAPLSVTVTAPVSEITGAIALVRRPLALALAALGAGLAAATLAADGHAGAPGADALGTLEVTLAPATLAATAARAVSTDASSATFAVVPKWATPWRAPISAATWAARSPSRSRMTMAQPSAA